MTVEEIQKSTEFQVFDRKSARIDAKTLAITIIAFANACSKRTIGSIAAILTKSGSSRSATCISWSPGRYAFLCLEVGRFYNDLRKKPATHVIAGLSGPFGE